MSLFFNFPSVFYIEPTNECNLNCIMCPREKSVKRNGYMQFELFTDIVDQISSKNIVELVLHLNGEPLLHPQILKMVAYAKQKDLPYVRLATNATLLDDYMIQGLIDSQLDSITVSMDTTSAKRYCPNNRYDELFAKLDHNISRLIKTRNQRGLKSPQVQMQIIEMKSTSNLISGFITKWEHLADLVTVKEMLSWSGHIKVPRKEKTRQLICINHLTQGVVQWNGDVSFCCLYIDSLGDFGGILGNAAQASMEEIFLGERRRTIIETQLRGDYGAVPFCLLCQDWVDILNWFHVEDIPSVGVEI